MSRSTRKKPKKVPELDLKREMALKNNRFSRYLLLRYSVALFFFINIYWLLAFNYRFSMYAVLPVGLLVLFVLASAEQFKLYSAKKIRLSNTERAFKAQAAIQVLMVAVGFLPGQLSAAVPFFANLLLAQIFFVFLQLLGLLICWHNLNRIKQIKRNKDKFYYRFQQQIKKYI